MSSGGRFYWARNRGEEFKSRGIIVIFAWISISDVRLKDFIRLYSSLGWSCLVCRSDYLNPYIPERATSLAFSLLDELIKELRHGLCPVVLAAVSGGSKACMYKVLQLLLMELVHFCMVKLHMVKLQKYSLFILDLAFIQLMQIIEGCSEVELSLEDSRLVASCISGQIYDSDPIEFTTDLGARFALNRSILKIPGSSKLISLFAKGVTSSLDALFITRFASQRAEYWQTLYSSVGLGAPFLILCSESDDMAPFSVLCNFAKHLQDVGGNAKIVKWSTSAQVGHQKHRSVQYASAISELLNQAVSVFAEKIQKLGGKSCMDDIHHEMSDMICDLQNAAVNSNKSFRRVAIGPNDHFFLPSSSEHQNNSRDFGSPQEERKERLPHRASPCMSANSVLGQILFDVCVPKNVEGWCLNVEPFISGWRRSPFNGIKHRRSRL
ncbi:hypothetical protein BUALT_Bualt15G0035900 [Buddleja alternifolia]|uniref:Uncharacterized protein n=1 Tax=Buddleja alternifolia TaxID=168488 RepID=A0AAV6WHM1_9LAMI|nr:hypothetical protein BUALT_Bualt15G0035900 [Buddleja alternifolia]